MILASQCTARIRQIGAAFTRSPPKRAHDFIIRIALRKKKSLSRDGVLQSNGTSALQEKRRSGCGDATKLALHSGRLLQLICVRAGQLGPTNN